MRASSFLLATLAMLTAVPACVASPEADSDPDGDETESESALTTPSWIPIEGNVAHVEGTFGYGEPKTIGFPEWSLGPKAMAFRAKRGQSVEIWARGPANERTRLWLFDARGTLLATGGDPADLTRSRHIGHTFARAGTYFVVVAPDRPDSVRTSTTRRIVVLGPPATSSAAASAPGAPESHGGSLRVFAEGTCSELYACPVGPAGATWTSPIGLEAVVTGSAQRGYQLTFGSPPPSGSNAIEALGRIAGASLVVDRTESPDVRYLANTPTGGPVYAAASQVAGGIDLRVRVPADPQSSWRDPNRYPMGCSALAQLPPPSLGATCTLRVRWPSP